MHHFGTFLLAVNVVIINIAAFVFSLEKAMLSLAVYYIVAKMINDGCNHGKSVITEKSDEIGERIIKELNVSITYSFIRN
ncbi:YitT family protein [Priestia flexa]|uniref:YitT family protein n=1 Tax=Priestia flexa TaxID=86664 RepID=UPI001CD1AC2F|nr:YitT family protein [Priestia flexa]MCA0968889.1 YitT family protein [Priestia flexa]